MLGVDRGASADEIKAAYRKQALKWHPDRHPPERRKEAERRFSAASRAHELLSDPERRQQHDLGGAAPGASGFQGGFAGAAPGGFPGGFPDVPGFEEVFRQLFGQAQAGVLRAGVGVRVLPDAAAVLGACRACGIDATNDALRVRALGRPGRVVRTDARDQTVKVRVDGVGEVWLGARAVRVLESGRGGGPFGGFRTVDSSVISMRQELVTLPDGRTVMRVRRVVRGPDGSVREEVGDVPLG